MGETIDKTEFIEPDMTRPIDLAAQIALVQPGATLKGMQLQALVDEAARRGRPIPNARRYVAYRDYPGAEICEMLVAAAERVWPDLPPREGMRRLGRLAYPTLKESLIGRVVFGAMGSDFPRLWKLVTTGYKVSANTGSVEVVELEELSVVIRMEEIYSWVDAWHVGIMEGAVASYGSTARVRVKMRGPRAADLWIVWTRPV